MSRLRHAVGGPGIDPRVWITWATVTEVGYDAEHGIFIDVQYQTSDGTNETALMGMPYAGDQFGAYFPVEVDDTVLIAVPMGDPGNGPCLISRQLNSADRPHPDFQSSSDSADATKDVIIRVKPGQRLVLRTSGAAVDIKVEGSAPVNIEAAAGDINLKVASGSMIKLGDGSESAPLQGVVNGEAIDTFTGATMAALGNASMVVAAKKAP